MSWIFDRLYHLHWVTEDVARSAQPYLGFYSSFLASHRFKSLVNLRGENADFRWWINEKRVASALGIRHFDVRLSSRNLPSCSGLATLFEAFATAERPLLLKCSGGQDRTGLAAALYLLELKGPSGLKEAEAQLASWPYLHFPKRHQLWLRHFPPYAVSEAGGASVGNWARQHYDPGHFANWLAARGLAASYRSVQMDRTR
jgi:protein tyrosine/serine phosphatase